MRPVTSTVSPLSAAFAVGLVITIDVVATVIETGAVVVVPPRSSVARTVSVCEPAGLPAIVALYGGVVGLVGTVAASTPSRKSYTFMTVPSVSAAVATTTTEAGAEND